MIDSRTFRDIIGRFATGVTVVTTAVDGRIHGMTANAVSSVSLDPLLLLVCVDKRSQCHAQLSQCERFGLSVLADDQEDISNLFARSSEPSAEFAGVSFAFGELGVPLVPNALGVFECFKHAVFDGGDHDVFVGRVGHGELLRPDAEPLIFFGGRYRQLHD